VSEPDLPTPPGLARRAADGHGDLERQWLRALPEIVAECGRRWSLTFTGEAAAPSWNCLVSAVTSAGEPVVLKLGFELQLEADALAHYDGRGAVRLLDADLDLGALLLEQLLPGTLLSSIADDEEAPVIAASLMRELWRPAPPGHTFPLVEDWARGLVKLRQTFDGGTGPLPVGLVERAEGLFSELLPSQTDRVVLHGDLHHENILRSQRRPWLAIDPKGVVGEPCYETGPLLKNSWGELAARATRPEVQARRIAIFSDLLGLDRERIRGWAVAQAVLSAWWCVEDADSGWHNVIACAEALCAAEV
jgi:streptomycin 6-kinase